MSSSELKCLYCSNKALRGPKCVKCSRIFHPGCVDRLKLSFVTDDDVICCDKNINSVSPSSDTLQNEAAAVKDDIQDNSFIRGREFYNIVKDVMEEKTAVLMMKICDLEQEVKDLKASNIDLVKLLCNMNKNDNISNALKVPHVPSFSSITGPSPPKKISAVHDKKADNSRSDDFISNECNFSMQRVTAAKINRPESLPTKQPANAWKVPRASSFSPITDPISPKMKSAEHDKKAGNSRSVDFVSKESNFSMQHISESNSGDLNDNNSGYIEVKSRKKKQHIVRGKIKPNENSSLKAAPRKAYIYVGNASLSTTCQDLEEYLQSQFSGKQFKIEKLPKRDTAKSVAFKLETDSNLMNSLLNEDSWPEGLIIKKFYFLRQNQNPAVVNGTTNLQNLTT